MNNMDNIIPQDWMACDLEHVRKLFSVKTTCKVRQISLAPISAQRVLAKRKDATSDCGRYLHTIDIISGARRSRGDVGFMLEVVVVCDIGIFMVSEVERSKVDWSMVLLDGIADCVDDMALTSNYRRMGGQL